MSDRRQEAGLLCELAMASYADGEHPGMMLILMISENASTQGHMEVDVALGHGDCHSMKGAVMIAEFSRRLRDAVDRVCKEMAVEFDADIVERPDIEVPYSGERPKA